MFEEIIAFLLSLCSAFTIDFPSVSGSETGTRSNGRENNGDNENSRLVKYNGLNDNANLLGSQHSDVYSATGNEENTSTLRGSLVKSLKTNFYIIGAIFLSASTGILFVWFDLQSYDLCFEWKNHSNNTIPFSVMRAKLIGDGIQTIILEMWLPGSLILLFGWNIFRRYYSSTIVLSLLTGVTATLFLAFLLLYNEYDQHPYSRVPCNLLFVGNLIVCCIIVVCKTRQRLQHLLYTNRQVFAVVSLEFLSSFTLSMYYRYVAVPWFNSLHNETTKFIIAILTPILAVLPVAICRYLVLRQSSEIIEPGRGFVLVYFMRGGSIILFRIMQADFGSLPLFISLSLFSSCVNVLRVSTQRLRNKFWAFIINKLQKTCWPRLRRLPQDTPNSRRLKADIEIQNILFENNTLIISQAYLILYTMTSFQVSEWNILEESIKRLAIGLSIEFVFNTISVSIFLYWFNVPIAQVWAQCWRRHVLANSFILVIIVCYFTQALVTVFQVRHLQETSVVYILRNCSMPF
ncbi:uncharacterized protein LOC124450631 [Xenia sp. Carnegie-2017]|uniref:uncharacterized protein LOC124450631 n=1 Tax=Xenia sp. Carnegie-2017 TaxID=2897299 RepID=UPI001F03FBD5|nr:uncharacterized protein LOC124450631 [Xenia sp. Carnegie-2017]